MRPDHHVDSLEDDRRKEASWTREKLKLGPRRACPEFDWSRPSVKR